MRTKSLNLFFASFALVCIACQQRPDEQLKKQAAPPPAPVTTVRLTDTSLTIERKYLGEVWATAEASLSTAEAGRVQKVHVVEGDKVKRGQVLLELDDRLARGHQGYRRKSLFGAKAASTSRGSREQGQGPHCRNKAESH
jgi:multidrug efflux pump subunit AcrA (membrane-fusion protein)